MRLKSDTYPVESNVHFPTDINLLWDSIRKSVDVLLVLLQIHNIEGWRKIHYVKKQLKSYYRLTAEIHRKKGRNYEERLKRASEVYLKKSKQLSSRIRLSMEEFELASQQDMKLMVLLEELKYFVNMLDKHVDLVERRLLNGEKIPHADKVFSIFEEHAEWLSKGKLNREVVIGHNVLITTDQYHFIVDHHVAIQEVDKELAIPLGQRLKEKYSANYLLEMISFDRGFYSELAKKWLNGAFGKVIMPKPGKKSDSVKEEESAPVYKTARRKHSAVESNINELEHSGVDRIPDKTLAGFKRYVALGVLAYNLKRLGKIIIRQNLSGKKIKARKSRKQAA